METSNIKRSLAALALLVALTGSSCKNNTTENPETAPPVVTTEGDTVHVDTTKVPLKQGSSTDPVIKKNSEDGTNSAL